MKEYLKLFWTMVVIIFTISALVFLGDLAGFYKLTFFAPKLEQVRYNTFKESQSYNDGMLRDMQELKLQYLAANPDQKIALRAIILQRFSVYSTDRLPPDLQSFYLSITQGNQQ
jgi:hypothetical protein